METKAYIKAVSKIYMCDDKLAVRIVASAELNHEKERIDKMVFDELKQNGGNQDGME
jgi:hypothetical protein